MQQTSHVLRWEVSTGGNCCRVQDNGLPTWRWSYELRGSSRPRFPAEESTCTVRQDSGTHFPFSISIFHLVCDYSNAPVTQVANNSECFVSESTDFGIGLRCILALFLPMDISWSWVSFKSSSSLGFLIWKIVIMRENAHSNRGDLNVERYATWYIAFDVGKEFIQLLNQTPVMYR